MKKQANRDNNTGLKLERFIGGIGVALSLVALFFISQQTKDNVFSPSSVTEWANYQQENNVTNAPYFVCIQRTRLSNIGGADSSVIKYDSTIYFKGKSATVSGEQKYAFDSIQSAKLEHIISSFHVDFVDGKTFETTSSDNNLFPIAIPSYSAVDIWTKATFWKNNNLASRYYFYPPHDYYQFLEHRAKYDELSPIEISFTFTTASGKSFATPRALCIFIK